MELLKNIAALIKVKTIATLVVMAVFVVLALRGDITTLTRDENANGGMWGLSLTCREPFAEVDLTGEEGTYQSAKAAYDNLKAQVQVGSVTMAVGEKKK